MDFRVEHEIRVIRKVVKHVHGPCLVCDCETEYGNRIPRLGMVWLRKQFEPDARRRNVRAVRIGVAPKGKSLAVLLVLFSEEDEAGTVWGQGLAREWSDELSDSRQDLYTLADGRPVDATR